MVSLFGDILIVIKKKRLIIVVTSPINDVHGATNSWSVFMGCNVGGWVTLVQQVGPL